MKTWRHYSYAQLNKIAIGNPSKRALIDEMIGLSYEKIGLGDY